MWFNQALVFHYQLEKSTDVNTALAQEYLKPCPPHAKFIYGWLPIFDDCFAHEVAGATLICMGKEERVLPRSVIQRTLEERIKMQEAQLLRSLKRAERAQMAEEIEFELLPKAFCLQKRLYALLDTKSQRLTINTSSQTQAKQLISLLRKAVPGIQFESIQIAENLASTFAAWINNPSTQPSNLQLASDCMLFCPEDEGKRLNCKGYELPSEEITTLLNQGHLPAEISILWHERIQLTLTDDFTLKRIKCLDVLLEEFNQSNELEEETQQRDAALTLLSGEFRLLIDDLLSTCKSPSSHETTLSGKAEAIA
jgi:recombination associated protein RdgC